MIHPECRTSVFDTRSAESRSSPPIQQHPSAATSSSADKLERSESIHNLGEKFLEVATTRWNHVAFIHDKDQTTFGELCDAALSIAHKLSHAPGWSIGDRVALELINSPAYAASLYGIVLAGGVVIPVPPGSDDRWKQTILKSTACRHLISGPTQKLVPSLSSMAGGADLEVFKPPEDLAAIFFTSGSTGIPKGVMLSHSNLLSNAEAIQQYLQTQETDRALALLPFFHAFGNSVLQSHLLAGATLVISGSITYPDTIVTALSQPRLNQSPVVLDSRYL